MSASEKDLIVGGQAVIEGVMMRTPGAYAIAVRRPDGTITHTAASLPKLSEKYPALRLPVLRGAAVLIQSMALGIKALNYSAAEAFNEAEEAKAVEVVLTPAVVEGEGDFAGITGGVPGLFPVPTKKRPEDELKRGSAAAFGSIAFALLFNVLLFVVAPLVLTNALFVGMGWADRSVTDPPAAASQQEQPAGAIKRPLTNAAPSTDTQAADAPWYKRTFNGVRGYLKPVKPNVPFNLIDGLIRMTIFITMIFSFSLAKDIRRVFEYHGAEHKTVFTWEAGLPLTVENARPHPRQHPRCGTSFLMVVMLVSIVLFSVVAFSSFAYNIGVRIVLIPFIAGLSYEIIRLSAKKESGLVFKLITRPGVWLQNITTKEPDDQQLEVALVALKESLKLEPQQQQQQEAALAPLS